METDRNFKSNPIRDEQHPDPLAKACLQAGDCFAQRQQGKAVLKDIIHRLRRKADNIQTLVDMLPEKPTREQDESLWELACSMER